MAAGGTPLKRQKRIFSHRILADEKKCARGGSGEIHPPMVGSPLGGAHGQGVRTASPYRPVGRQGLTGRAPGRGGGRQAASKQRASKKANGWEPPRGGAWARGANGKPLSSRRATGAYRTRPWAGRGAASSEQATSKQEGKWLGAPWGAHGQGVRTASPYRPVGRQGLTGCAPGWGGGKLQQARLLCPRITGAKGVNLVDMRY